MKISVIIVTYNRWHDLKNTINAYLNQTYKNVEIIVIDNASIDETRVRLPLEFPTVRYVWLPENFEIRSLNIAIELSTGEILWRCDDDSHPIDASCFEQVISIFKKHRDIHIIAGEVVIPKNNNAVWDWYPKRVNKTNVPDTGYKSHYFSGAAVGIRRCVTDRIGGFWGFGNEEIDFSTRAILSGFNIRYFPNLVSAHNVSPGGREKSWRWVTMCHQMMRYRWKYYPFWKALFASLLAAFTQLLIGIYRYKKLTVLLEGLVAMFAGAFYAINNERQVVTGKQLRDITLSSNLIKDEYKFIKSSIKGILFRRKNKKVNNDNQRN